MVLNILNGMPRTTETASFNMLNAQYKMVWRACLVIGTKEWVFTGKYMDIST